MIQKFSPLHPAPLRGLPRTRRPAPAQGTFALAAQRLLPGLLLKTVVVLGALEFIPAYGLFLGDLFGQIGGALSFVLARA